jgi:tetratricopeptide (TPR) repeat protein
MTDMGGSARAREWALIAGLLLSLGAATVGLLAAAERERPPAVRALELAYLPKGEYLKVAVLGYRQIASDLIWLKAVQHFGERKQTVQGWMWAYHATDVVTDLDPKFVFAYQAAGTILGVWAGRPHESIALLTKGMRENPESWQLPFYAGYDYFFELHDADNAAKYFRIAAALPGAPDYLPKLAARMTVEAGDPQAALEFLERLYVQTQDERLREGLAHRMKEVVAERDIRFLEEGVRRYKARYRKWPVRLEDLVRGGIITEIPAEPFGGAYLLAGPDGTVKSTGLRERLRAHRKG